MCHKANQSNIEINQSMKKISLMLGPHQSPIYFAWINPTNSIVLELWELSSCLLKIKEIILKSKKICESAYLKGNVASLFKTRFLVT